VSTELEALVRSWERSLRARNLAPATLRTYGRGVRAFLEHLAETAPEVTAAEQVRRAELEEFLAHLASTRSAATAKIRHTALAVFFKWLAEEEEIAKNPMAKVRAPSVPEQPVPVLGDNDLRALLRACESKTFADRRDMAIIRLFIDTGMRRSELASLRYHPTDETRSDLDLDAQVAVVMGKGRRARAAQYGSRTATALDRYLRIRARHPVAARSDALWLGDLNKGPITDDGIEQMIRRRASQAGLGRVHAHMLRHTAAHQWLAAGGQEQDLMSLLGWRSRAMLARYGASAAAERAREAHRRLALGDRL
jgi:integrase/recombinase XerC